MKIGSVALAYNEQRFIVPHLKHLPDWIDEKLVLVSTKPWFGQPESADKTAQLAKRAGAKILAGDWPNEETQRNASQAWHQDKDWIIVLDPDEFLDKDNWQAFYRTLQTSPASALVVKRQYTYWKKGWVADPPQDYLMLIAVRPWVRFVDKRVVNQPYQIAPVELHHFSWAKSDDEVWRKISHYAHAQAFDTDKWFKDVWKAWQPGMQDVHPTTPQTLHNLIPANLPSELEALKLWP